MNIQIINEVCNQLVRRFLVDVLMQDAQKKEMVIRGPALFDHLLEGRLVKLGEYLWPALLSYRLLNDSDFQ